VFNSKVKMQILLNEQRILGIARVTMTTMHVISDLNFLIPGDFRSASFMSILIPLPRRLHLYFSLMEHPLHDKLILNRQTAIVTRSSHRFL
jgi:hypothetical protein